MRKAPGINRRAIWRNEPGPPTTKISGLLQSQRLKKKKAFLFHGLSLVKKNVWMSPTNSSISLKGKIAAQDDGYKVQASMGSAHLNMFAIPSLKAKNQCRSQLHPICTTPFRRMEQNSVNKKNLRMGPVGSFFYCWYFFYKISELYGGMLKIIYSLVRFSLQSWLSKFLYIV
ncbi:hypothetical protein MEZE111188_13295 [Mesobacillus zeae]